MKLAARWGAAFLLASLLCWPLLPFYAKALAPAVGALWNACASPEHAMQWDRLDTALRWHWAESGASGQQSARLWTCNLALLLAGIAAVNGLTLRQRLRGLGGGLVGLLLWHIFDLLLSIESQWLTKHEPQGYDLAAPSLWFLLVKFLNNLNVLALRQLLPLLMVAAIWHLARDTQKTLTKG